MQRNADSKSSSGEKVSAPCLKTEIPGPRSVEMLGVLAEHECPAITARRARRQGETGVSQDPIVWKQGRGSTIEDVDGNVFLDFTAAFAVSAYGHANPELQAALNEQSAKLLHGMGDVYPTDVKIKYSQTLAHFLPGDLSQSIFGQSGADAVEAALKSAAMHSRGKRVIAFDGAYHGLSLGALSVSAYKGAFKTPFSTMIAQHVSHAPYAYCYRCPFKSTYPSCGLACLEYFQHMVEHPASGAEDVGAVILEPIQGRGGVVVPPVEWLEGVTKICKEKGIVLIFDEIFSGFGRTGERFAMEHFNLVPDIVCLGKGMTGGFPMSAVVGTAQVMSSWGTSAGEAIHTSTFLGNPMGCAVGLKAIEIFERDELDKHATAMGRLLEAKLFDLKDRFPRLVGDVRGEGLMRGAELVDAEGHPNGKLSLELMRRMLEKGVLLLPSGVWGQVLTFTPPLVIEEEHIETMYTLLLEALNELV